MSGLGIDSRDVQHLRDEAAIRKAGWEDGREEGLKEGLKEGEKKGREEGERIEREKIARNMLAMGLSNELIVKSTGLSVEEINSINGLIL